MTFVFLLFVYCNLFYMFYDLFFATALSVKVA